MLGVWQSLWSDDDCKANENYILGLHCIVVEVENLQWCWRFTLFHQSTRGICPREIRARGRLSINKWYFHPWSEPYGIWKTTAAICLLAGGRETFCLPSSEANSQRHTPWNWVLLGGMVWRQCMYTSMCQRECCHWALACSCNSIASSLGEKSSILLRVSYGHT